MIQVPEQIARTNPFMNAPPPQFSPGSMGGGHSSSNSILTIAQNNNRKKSAEDENEGVTTLTRKSRTFDWSIGTVFAGDARSVKIPRVIHIPALSVLIVDDSVTQPKLAMKAFGGQIDDIIWMIDTAENGERAMQLVERSPRPPDVIIIDQNMESTGGQLLGHEVVAKLRRNVYFRSVVIIGCTGFFESAEKHFINAGCDAVWPKPIPSKEDAQRQINQFITLKKRLIQQQMQQRHNFSSVNQSFTFTIPTPPTPSSYRESKFSPGTDDMQFQSTPVFQQMKEEYHDFQSSPSFGCSPVEEKEGMYPIGEEKMDLEDGKSSMDFDGMKHALSDVESMQI